MGNLSKVWKIYLDEFYRQKSNYDRILFLLRFAILAPSTHNSQPWLFKAENNSCKIYYDPNLRLKEADRSGRNLYISLGCCLENLITVARYFRVYKKTDYICKRQRDNLVAEVFFENLNKSKKEDTTLRNKVDAIMRRINIRGIFQAKQLPEKVINKLKSIETPRNIQVHFVTDPARISKLARLTAEGIKQAYGEAGFRRELSTWMHSPFASKKDGIPGYSLRLPTILSFVFPTLVRFFDLSKIIAAINFKSMNSVSLVCVISAKDGKPLVWLKVGRLAQRLMLQLNAENIKTSIFVAAVDIGNLYREVQKVLQIEYVPQFLFCGGYTETKQKHTPRHPVSVKVIS